VKGKGYPVVSSDLYVDKLNIEVCGELFSYNEHTCNCSLSGDVYSYLFGQKLEL
jgi:hypothetical protein